VLLSRSGPLGFLAPPPILTRRNRAVEDVVVEVAGRGVKVVLATHDLGEARRLAGKVVFMVRGRARESAPATSFFDRLLPKRKPLSTGLVI
jgi:ABC-type polar amino acid transport system ATPase subunit